MFIRGSKHNSRQLGLRVYQGGIKFEILWEPNFPVNNFARNNEKNGIIIQTIIHAKINEKAGQKCTVKGSIYGLAVNGKNYSSDMKKFSCHRKYLKYLNFYDRNKNYLACHRKHISYAMKYPSCEARCSLFLL